MWRKRLLAALATVLVGGAAAWWYVESRPGGGDTSPNFTNTRKKADVFPDAASTGVLDGTSLRSYDGPCTIKESGTVIEASDVRCPLLIQAADVVIRNSKVTGSVKVEGKGHSLLIEDSDIDGGEAFLHTVGFENLTVLRSDIVGGQSAVNCYLNCVIQDSYLHNPFVPEGGDWHLNGFLSNGGTNIKLIGNTLACDRPTNKAGGGCTSNASIFGDLGPNSDYTIQGNLFVASTEMSYCFYGGYDAKKKFGTQSERIVVVDNVFQRGPNGECASFGTVTSFNTKAPGNEWRGNRFVDGKAVEPSAS
ncbi:hypothetical protein QLQ12_24195 [Actinoplanes sp. NEAU-A12]|uniref:Right handed beta helix domain-containing protein n=1 Tax=Actinoplanes sandaracinus TaxID=3045177 RepID=A0ABT6WPR5_9ACTN|nr:hypothetical protein [Actinoplanes sandaracinus]MDI6101727.1 hypothetical protein [Actinoplanes sandaracinus]